MNELTQEDAEELLLESGGEDELLQENGSSGAWHAPRIIAWSIPGPSEVAITVPGPSIIRWDYE